MNYFINKSRMIKPPGYNNLVLHGGPKDGQRFRMHEGHRIVVAGIDGMHVYEKTTRTESQHGATYTIWQYDAAASELPELKWLG